jgi:hypothetical protein
VLEPQDVPGQPPALITGPEKVTGQHGFEVGGEGRSVDGEELGRDADEAGEGHHVSVVGLAVGFRQRTHPTAVGHLGRIDQGGPDPGE